MRSSRHILLSIGILAGSIVWGAVEKEEANMKVLVIDPLHCESGRFCKRALSDLPAGWEVESADLGSLPDAEAGSWDVVVGVHLDPGDYETEARERLERFLSGLSGGLLVFGTPEAEDRFAATLAMLGDRSPADPGPHFYGPLAGGQWIWAAEGARPESTIYFRRAFDVVELPARAWLEITVDNRQRVWLNGHDIGASKDWMTPSVYDVTDRLRPGRNVLAVEAANEDGPAGLIASLNGYAADGSCPLRVCTGEGWRQTDRAEEGWLLPDFDHGGWGGIATLGDVTSPPWWSRLLPLSLPREQPLEVGPGPHPVLRGIEGELGITVVPNGLAPRAGADTLLRGGPTAVAVAAEGPRGRTIVFSGHPERRALDPGRQDVLETPESARFVAQSVLWLAGVEGATVAPTAVTSASVEGEGAPSAAIDPAEGFPVVMQIYPLPRPGVRLNRQVPRDREGLRQIVDDIRDHGFTVLGLPAAALPEELGRYAADYAQSRGLLVNHMGHGAELFGRDVKMGACAYGADYEAAVREKVRELNAVLTPYPRLHSAFVYNDEPFYAGPQAFSYRPEILAEFEKRYGYAMPPDLDSIRDDPRRWLDVLNFRADYFPDAWRVVCRAFKELNPGLDIVITHDSHNTFGGGVGQEEVLAINDVFHWGADFADIIVFDIYPYMMWDFRYGENRDLPKPRLAQAHYAMGQMRNLATTYGKTAGFWFGSYSGYWFWHMTDEHRQAWWAEREMAYTAIAHGADFLISGYGIPEETRHWETLGRGMRQIQQVASGLKRAPRLQARAAFLFPRTQYLQLQEEYWNVAQSYELFLRAFGELDILHEEQIVDSSMNGYELLVLFDVSLLPAETAGHVAAFVEAGGTVLADCVPSLGKFREPMQVMERLFGVAEAVTDRVLTAGEASSTAGRRVQVRGRALGLDVDLPVVSPRPCRADTADVLLTSDADAPALLRRQVGSGQAYLLGFCLQDTCFDTWKRDDPTTRDGLRALLQALAEDAGVRPRVHSSNPGIEAAIRANPEEGFLFLINHESTASATRVRIADLPFDVRQMTDTSSGNAVRFEEDGETLRLQADVPFGEVALYRLTDHIAKSEGGRAEFLAAAPDDAPSEGKGLLRVFMIDVANGHFVCESLLIITPGGKAMLIDAGFPSPTFRYAGKEHHYGTNAVPAFLEAQGIDTLDWMMLSHPHDDHIGDMPKFVDGEELTVKKVLWSPLPDERILKAEPADGAAYIEPVQALRAACERKQIPMVAVKAGDVLDLGDGVVGHILCAARPEVDVPNYINNNSIVMRLTYGDFSMLFTGDAGVEEERAVMASTGEIASDVLKMGHHAGAGSNSPEWIAAVDARVGLGSMPKWLSDDDRGKRVYDLLMPTGMKFYRTWEHGDIAVQSDGKRFWVAGSGIK